MEPDVDMWGDGKDVIETSTTIVSQPLLDAPNGSSDWHIRY